MSRTPIYFLSHGGPNVMYETNHPAYHELVRIGNEITTRVKPKAIVVFSAHWQASENDKIEINTSEETDLIYDFYGFPPYYYQEKYPNVGSKAIAEKVMKALSAHAIDVEPVSRGLDHGIWASFKVAFDPEKNALNVPIVQVSLFGSEDPYRHYALGKAVADLRLQNIAILVSGMAVHNLRDHFTMADPSKAMPYTASFDEALKTAVESEPAEREQNMANLLKRGDARQAHPTFDHLLPIFVGAGAAGEDKGTRLWTMEEGGIGWAQYRFGEVAAA